VWRDPRPGDELEQDPSAVPVACVTSDVTRKEVRPVEVNVLFYEDDRGRDARQIDPRRHRAPSLVAPVPEELVGAGIQNAIEDAAGQTPADVVDGGRDVPRGRQS
jgi:hypothetical protein